MGGWMGGKAGLRIAYSNQQYLYSKYLYSKIKVKRKSANLCTTSKIFEKLVQKRLLEIQDNEGVDLTGGQQHGFKRK
jgi:hypothetical protein